MLSGILAGQEFNSELIGDESLSRRPMTRIIAPLNDGAKVAAQNGRSSATSGCWGKLKAVS